MALTAGTKLGPYEIVAAAGAGGMGEVYRARDTRLGRDVAIKVLPSHLSSNSDLRQRFEREAKAISSLNHPHICTLYDVGRQEGIDFLVMEFVEGETLGHRVERGALPVEQVIPDRIQEWAMRIAITRRVSPAFARCELTHLARTPIDLRRAAEQHERYEECLRGLGCEVLSLAAEPELPDSVFVEDAALVLEEAAVLTRPGAESRRGETESLARALAPYRKLLRIEAPGTLDGGDVLRLGRRLYAGRTSRSNREGIAQLATLVAPYGYTVVPVEVRGCLHLKTAVTQVAENTLLINSRMVERASFGAAEFVEVDPGEPHAGNALLLDQTVVYPAANEKTRRRLEERGIKVAALDVSEVLKAEGGVTCCSLVFSTV